MISRVIGSTNMQPALRTFLAFVFPGPIEVCSLPAASPASHLGHGFFDGAAKVTATHAVFDGDIAGIGLTVDFRSAVEGIDVGDLRQGNALSGGSHDADVLDGFFACRGMEF